LRGARFKRGLASANLMKRSLALIGVALAIVGWYAPWVTSARQLAALTYNALDLAEFSKFIVRAGIASITREWFLVPIVAAALALALWANSPGQLIRLARYALTLLAAVLSLVPLPPYPFLLKAYSSAEDRGPFWLCVAGVLGIALIFAFGRRIAGRWHNVAFGVLALIGVLPAGWEFFGRALPAISQVYGSPARLAWGLWVMLIGFVVLAASAALRES
jgi:hypothetical protein